MANILENFLININFTSISSIVTRVFSILFNKKKYQKKKKSLHKQNICVIYAYIYEIGKHVFFLFTYVYTIKINFYRGYKL